MSWSLLNTCLVLATLVAAPALAADDKRPDKVSFYFAAHQDDWQLFMNPPAFQDVLEGAKKTVFVHMTAGDAGLGTGHGGRKHPLYLARENGAEAAIRFMADTDSTPAEKVASTMTLNGHPIYRIAYRNTVSYFLRVADGDALGKGYAETGFQSLRQLAEQNRELAAVDGSTVYRSWSDLVTTIGAIISYERGNARLIQLNVSDPDPKLNPNDHSDHVMTAKAALDAAATMPRVRRVYYVDYAAAKLAENLSAQLRDMQSSVYAVTLAGVMALDHKTSWRHYDESFVGRNYFRVEEPTDLGEASSIELAASKH